jgi:hypothetical protein
MDISFTYLLVEFTPLKPCSVFTQLKLSSIVLTKMNKWVARSIEIANGPAYLDMLSEIYPVTSEAKRELPPGIRGKIIDAYEAKNGSALVEALLKLPKFPIKDPYVAFLRQKADFLAYNPQTIDRIAQRLFSMSFGELMASCEEPKEFNRQIGPLFRRWLRRLPYPFLPENEFDRYEGIAFLEGSNGQLSFYANTKLGCDLDRGLDFVVKVGNKCLVGEGKFITAYGGHQDRQFDRVLQLVRGQKGKAIRIAVLDGVVWMKSKASMFRIVSQLEETALSGLLLNEFLESLR